ncbi:oligoendopeptidase F [Anaerotalea alkaliphila]|uniref:Oligopeptidase F n=1 Tax=Anaerotalea alkaliphila TaxID=2662126 RepID=A0A7X5HUZ3_9FIRM|nr:oligoendopeptidase F [Anaerotalea alkaliphila]NDL67105.1 oligoendopeptidase F [Anaerotalea alkaliphila]
MEERIRTRQEMEEKDTWRLEDIFECDQAWEEAFQEVARKSDGMKALKGTLGKGAKAMGAALEARDILLEEFERLHAYAHMRLDQDTANGFYQGMDQRVKGLQSKVMADTAFLIPEILAVPEGTMAAWVEEESLATYRQHLEEILEEKPHVLDEARESLLAQAAEVLQGSGQTFGMLNNADLKFPPITGEDGQPTPVTHSRFLPLLQSGNREVRKAAYASVCGVYGQFRNTFASLLGNTVKKHVFTARIRNFRSAREAALSANHIPETVYDNLVATIRRNLPLLHRYLRLRKQMLGLDTLHMYDLHVPLVGDVEMEIPYGEAKGILLDALAPLGRDYNRILAQGLSDRWVDVYENRGKRSGAYSSGAYGTPPYILMNYEGNLNSLFTLAHEAGHSMHSWYSRRSQPYVYGDYSIFVAEVASTCNESLLNRHLLSKTQDQRTKLHLLNHVLEGFRNTVFRQTLFAEFEHAIHKKVEEGEGLTAELLSSLYLDLNRDYYGPEVELDDSIAVEWSRIPHFHYNHYVYQYATGYSAAAALSRQILGEGRPAVIRYLDFLAAGRSLKPIDALRKAGVDMETPEAVEAACRVFEETLLEMEALAGVRREG